MNRLWTGRPESARTWRKIACFYALTLLFSTPFYWTDARAPGNVTLITGVMWSPGLAAFATRWLFGESTAQAYGLTGLPAPVPGACRSLSYGH